MPSCRAEDFCVCDLFPGRWDCSLETLGQSQPPLELFLQFSTSSVFPYLYLPPCPQTHTPHPTPTFPVP